MLKFYETYQKYNVPSNLDGQILDTSGVNINTISHINKVNIFIGANNSGKSKILRELLRQDSSQYYGDKNWKEITEIITNLFDIFFTKMKEIFIFESHYVIRNSHAGEVINTADVDRTKKSFLTYSISYDINTTINYIKHQFISLPDNLNTTQSYYVTEINSNQNVLDGNTVNKLLLSLTEIKPHANEAIKKLNKFQFASSSKEKIPRIYIPSIRTLRPFGADADIEKETRREYGFLDGIDIYNGQNLPSEVFKLKNSVFLQRKKLVEFEELLSAEFFESKKVSLTFDNDTKVLLIKIGDEMERPIHELGDGLQMIIILTFPFFDNKSGVIAIEEPELFIHPGLQKKFIKFLISNSATENFQIFLATHSNHIIDSINNSDLVSLFSVKKQERPNDTSLEKMPNFIVENLAYGNSNLLNLLGITTTSVYLSNCTIWVEGITDRIYIQKFISEYLKSIDTNSKYYICNKYQEGVNYSFALTAGDSIIHWDFSDESEYFENTHKILVHKFCSKSLVIIDNDFGKNPKRKALLKQLLGDRFIEIENPEIENLLSQTAINKTILDYPTVSKVIKEHELATIKPEILLNKKLGFIIDRILLKMYPQTKSFASNKGEKSSLKNTDKFDFCTKAITHISKENLTKESINLVERILDFIISKNN